jgi:hypothetical protein
VTIELSRDGVEEISALVRTAAEQVEAAKLMQQIAPALDEFDRAVRKQLDSQHERHPVIDAPNVVLKA